MNIEPGKTAGVGDKLIPNPTLKLQEQFHEVIRFKHLSERTETAYWQWVVRFLKFHRHGGEGRHPRVLPASAVAEFLADLSVRLKVAAATQNQALNVLVFLYDVFLPRGDYPTRRGGSRARPGAGIIGRKIICNGR